MFRPSRTMLRLGKKFHGVTSFPIYSIVGRKEFTTKETAKRLTKDAGQYAQDSSKVLYRLLEELSTSNEVKLVRLSAIRAFEVGQELFDKHVLKNPRFQAYLVSLRAKLDQISTAPESVKSLPKKEEPTKIGQETEKGLKGN